VAHLDPERLILVAFGEQHFSTQEAEHLESCETCVGNMSGTLETIGVARETHQTRDLPELPPDLWPRIAEEAFAHPHAVSDAPSEPGVPGRWRRPTGPPAQRRYQQLRRSTLLAMCAVIAGIAATLGAQWLTEKPQQVVAEASLLSKNVAAQAARGTAKIIKTDKGLQMKVDVSGMPPTDGYYEVWVYDGSKAMIPVGTLGSAPLNLPSSIRNISSFPVIDISLQKIGQQAHGITMLQGHIDQ
jgi:hypothetical protein